MTTIDLDRLTSPAVAHEEEQARQRSNFRPPFLECVADIAGLDGPYEARLENGTPYTAVALTLTNLAVRRVAPNASPITDSTYRLELRLPRNPNPHAEVTLLVESAGKIKPEITSVRHLVGLRQVHLVEAVHQYTGSQFVADPNGSKTNNQGQRGDWKDVVLTTRFYEVVSIGSASNGHRTFSDEELEQAAKKINQLSSNEAMTALGDGAADILSRLILSGKVRQETGEDGEKRYVTVASF